MKRVSGRIFVAVAFAVSLIAVVYFGVRTIQLNREAERNDYAWAVDLLETNFNLYLEDFGIDVFDYYQGEGYLGLNEVTYIAYVVPIDAMDYLDTQIKAFGWIEYSADLYNSLSDKHSIWLGFCSASEINKDVEHGYVLFLDSNVSLEFSDGREPITADEAVIFYNTTTGRIYIYTQTFAMYI